MESLKSCGVLLEEDILTRGGFPYSSISPHENEHTKKRTDLKIRNIYHVHQFPKITIDMGILMAKEHMIRIFAFCILIALFMPAVSAEACSFCEFINISNITRGVTDHALLKNLSADNHPQYILTAGTRAFTGKQSLGGFNLTDLLDPVAAQDAATKNYVDLVNASMQAYVDAKSSIADHGLLSNLSGDGHPQYLLVNGSRAMTENLSMGSHAITGLAAPSVSTDAATKGYVDAHTDAAPGSDTQIMYNAEGAEAGNANFTFENTTGTVTANYFVGDGAGLTGINAQGTTVNINYTFTGLPGTEANVTNIGNETAALFDITIPKGDTGDTGAPGSYRGDWWAGIILQARYLYRSGYL